MLGYRRLALRHRVIVNLKGGQAVAGILTRKAGPLLEIRQAELYDRPGAPPAKIDGAVVLERVEVAFIQVLDAPAPARSREV